MCVCHRCDNRRCVNPEHLWEGSIADNNNDMKTKGRSRGGNGAGESSPVSKLDNKSVIYIKKSDKAYVELAKMFDVSESNIRMIKSGNTWKHIRV